MLQALKTLAVEFPDKTERIARLSKSDTRFVKLVNAYHALNREITRNRGNSGAEVEHLHKMRRIVRGKIESFLN